MTEQARGSVATVNDADAGDCLTTDEVAARLRVSPRTVRTWRSEGTGPRYAKLGRSVRYRRSSVDGWVAGLERDGT